MNKKEFAVGIKILEDAYTNFHVSDTDSKMSTWYELLKDIGRDQFIDGIRRAILTNKYPPTVAELRALMCHHTEITETEAWGYMSKALSNSVYHAAEEWARLPESVRAIVSPDLMREWALLDTESVQTVIASNFMRSYKAKTKMSRDQQLIGNAGIEMPFLKGVD